MEAAGLAAKVVMMVFLVYFLLLSGDLFKRKLVSLAGPRLSQMKTTVEILDEIEGQVQRYLLVEALTAVIVGAATWAALAALGLEQAVLWGILAGVLNTIPYFGPVIVTAAIVVVGFLQFGALPRALAVGGAALAVTSLEGWLLRPALFGRATRMNHVAIFVGLIFWGWVWGVVGVLLAVPLMTVIKAVCDRVDVLQPVGELIGD
jgi:predicted PurR-regulated permease PerM